MKLNSYFEFPENFDLTEFVLKIENVPKEYYEYSLCGAVIHSRTINGGHYWSWVKQGN